MSSGNNKTRIKASSSKPLSRKGKGKATKGKGVVDPSLTDPGYNKKWLIKGAMGASMLFNSANNNKIRTFISFEVRGKICT